MSAQKKISEQKTAPPHTPLAWWKKLLIAVLGTWLAAKLFGILIPDVSAAKLPSRTNENNTQREPDLRTGAYPDDTWDHDTWDNRLDDTRNDTWDDDAWNDAWDEPEDAVYEDDDDLGHDYDESEEDLLYNDWKDWGEGYDDDHFD